jgi:DNA invertase Pin-like site-specific DNA recombinase
MTAALYARASLADPTCENQLLDLRRHCETRNWSVRREFVDTSLSSSTDRRPALEALIADARRRRVGVLVCWRLDRLGRNLCHLVRLLEELRELGIGFVSLGEGIDLGTPAGHIQLHFLAALATFERRRFQERVRAGLARVRAQGRRLGRPVKPVPLEKLDPVRDLSVRAAARELKVSRSTVQRWRTLARR